MFLKSDEIQALSFMLWQIYTQLGSRKLRAKFVTKKKLNIIVDEYDGETLSHNEDHQHLQHDMIVKTNGNTDSRKEKRTFSYVK